MRPPDAPLDDRQLLIKDLADLCRRNPATFRAVVEASDHWQAEGMPREAAIRRALDAIG